MQAGSSRGGRDVPVDLTLANINEQPPTVSARSTFMDDEATAPSTPVTAMASERPSSGFILRIPASAAGGGHSTPTSRLVERANSPASAPPSAGKRKRRADPPGDTIAATRPRRGRLSSPGNAGTATGSPSLDGGSSAPSSRAASSQPPHGHALSIFAAPPSNDVAAEFQTIVGPRAAKPLLREKEKAAAAAAAEENAAARARPTRGGETHIRSGVSASGRGRRVGSRIQSTAAPKTNASAGGRKSKGAAAAKPPDADFVNQDFCSACRGIGRFLCCDGCPRSFHFMCLDPPLRIDELPQEETWYCNKCRAERSGAPPAAATDSPTRAKEKPITSVFRQLARRAETENPQQFRLPQEIRQFFTGVAAGPMGEYVDTEGARTKTDRKGFQEERDPWRLRDGKSYVQCYKCGGSSIPTRSLASDLGAQWRAIVSCDYCNLSWHLDCLSPPLASMPNSARKWMCPNHSDQVMPRRRTVRNGLETVDVEGEGVANNGNVVVIDHEEPKQALPHEDMVINNRRYRVPERIIQLDFWNKLGIGRGPREAPAKTAKRAERAQEAMRTATQEDLDAAHLMLSFATPPAQAPPSNPLPPPVAARPHQNGAGPSSALASAADADGDAIMANTPSSRGARGRPTRSTPVATPTATHAKMTRSRTPLVNGKASSPHPPPPRSNSRSPVTARPPNSGHSDAPRRITLRVSTPMP